MVFMAVLPSSLLSLSNLRGRPWGGSQPSLSHTEALAICTGDLTTVLLGPPSQTEVTCRVLVRGRRFQCGKCFLGIWSRELLCSCPRHAQAWFPQVTEFLCQPIRPDQLQAQRSSPV